MRAPFTLPGPLRDRLVALAIESGDREACALLGGPSGGRAARVAVAVPNVAGDPRFAPAAADLGLAARDASHEYLADPAATVRCLRAFRGQGLRLVAIFHSHPAGPGVPSATDVRLAAYPGCVQLIGAPESGGVALRGFDLAGGAAAEVPLLVPVAPAGAAPRSVSSC